MHTSVTCSHFLLIILLYVVKIRAQCSCNCNQGIYSTRSSSNVVSCPGSCAECTTVQGCTCQAGCGNGCPGGYSEVGSDSCSWFRRNRYCSRNNCPVWAQQCTKCAEGYYYPQSSVDADVGCISCPRNGAGQVCSNLGTCDQGLGRTGKCTCLSGYAGSFCQYSNQVQCSNNQGAVNDLGQCTCKSQYSPGTWTTTECPANSAGVFNQGCCSRCATNYFSYPGCKYCLASSTCNGKGVCDANGNCQCSTGYRGTNCEQCSTDYYGWPACTYCVNVATCNNPEGGYCNTANGACICYAFHSGATCNICDAGRYGRQCLACPGGVNNPCGASLSPPKGACNQGFTGNGSCICIAPNTGPECMTPVITRINPSSGLSDGNDVFTISGVSLRGDSTEVRLDSATGPTLVQLLVTDTAIQARIASGTGSRSIFVITTRQGVTGSRISDSATIRWTYLPPSIGATQGLVVSNGPTTGGYALTLTGQSFGALQGTVTFDGQRLPSTSVSLWDHSIVVFTIPAGMGANKQIWITDVSNRNSTPAVLFTYDPPVITNISPRPDTSGNVVVTLSGSNFGTLAGQVVIVTVGSFGLCSNAQVQANLSRILCTAPPSRGTNVAITVSRAGQDGTSLIWTTNGPTITSVSGCQPDPSCAQCTKDCPVGTPQNITITGTNFGPLDSNIVVLVGTSACTRIRLSVAHTQIICQIPPLSGRANVTVSIDGKSDSKAFLAFASPIINPSTLRLASSGSGGSTLQLNSFASTQIVFGGRFWGLSASAVNIFFGPSENPRRYTCNVTDSQETSVTCTLPTGPQGGFLGGGRGLVFSGTVFGIGSNIGTDTLGYPLPTILDGSLGVPGRPTGSLLRSETNQGELIQFNGTNFGNILSEVKVFYGPASNYSKYQCAIQQFTPTSIQCVTQASQGASDTTSLRISVSVGPGTAAQHVLGNIYYEYPTPPSVYRVSGCTDMDNSTVLCPTEGRPVTATPQNPLDPVRLTIYGENFLLGTYSSTTASVTVGGNDCVNVIHDADYPNQILTCQLPAGAGLGVFVVVTQGTRSSTPLQLLDYSPPAITRVSGCNDSDATTLDCPRAGGINITLYGTNFGGRRATVIVGGQACTNVSHTPSLEHYSLTCVLPSGTRLNRDVRLIQDLGELSPLGPRLSYSQCPAGTYRLNLTCIDCGAGFYTSVPAQLNCARCPEGKFASDNASAECEECPPGYFTAVVNSTECSPCQPGYAQPNSGSDGCPICEVGRVTGLGAAAECEICPIGKFSNETGQSSCFDCAPGYYNAAPDQTFCKLCAKGTFQPLLGQAECSLCPLGRFSEAAGLDEDCSLCSPGSYAGLPGLFECSVCPRGTFSGQLGQFLCESCPPGKYQPNENSTECWDCPLGSVTLTPGLTACIPCEEGKFAAAPSIPCQSCPEGKYQNSDGQADCLLCEPGLYSPTPAASRCLACPPGTFAEDYGHLSCDPCPLGSSSPLFDGVNEPNRSTCAPCAAGRYADEIGLVSCKLCSNGQVMNTTGASRCISCPPGTRAYVDGVNQTNSHCEPCAEGKFTAISEQVVCNDCFAGRFGPDIGLTVCSSCDRGYYQDEKGQPQCKLCEPGKYTQTVRQTVCAFCPSGTFNNGSEVGCTLCPFGKYSFQLNSEPITECTDCAPGKYSEVVGANRDCQLCPLGRFAGGTGSVTCQICTEGYFQASMGMEACDQCPPGRFQTANESSVCLTCPEGKYQNRTQATTCVDCEAGYFSANSETMTCSACPAGFFQGLTGKSVCTSCDPGKFSADIGRIRDCDFCDLGAYQPAKASNSCQLCPPGKRGKEDRIGCAGCERGSFQNLWGESECKPCPRGSSASSPNAEICASCPSGRTQNNTGSTECELCAAGRYSVGLVECAQCPPGQFQKLTGQSACSDARIGYYPIDQSTNQGICENRKIAPVAGMRECVPCLPGALSDDERKLCVCDVGFLDLYADIERTAARNNITDFNANPLEDLVSFRGKCIPCPQGASCGSLGISVSNVETLRGWWREANDTLTYYRCLLSEHCLGGYNSACGDNREGPLCAVCKPGYRSATVYSNCNECPKKAASVTTSVFIILILVSALVILYWIVIRNDRPLLLSQEERDKQETDWDKLALTGKASSNEPDPKPVSAESTTESRARPTFMYKLKILLGFLQISTNLAFVVEVPWPPTYASFLRAFSFVNLDFVPWQSVGCVSKFNYYTKFLVITLTPLAILSCLILFFLVPHYIIDYSDMRDDDHVRRLARKRTRRQFWKLLLFTFFLLYPGVSSTVLSIFSCKYIVGVPYLVTDFTVVCFDSRWFQFLPLAITMVLVYPIGVPLAFFFFIRKYSHRHNDPDIRVQLGFLYEAYHSDAWYFEMLDMAHKLFLTSIVGFFPTMTQMPFAMVGVILYSISILWVVPYIRRGDDRLHLFVQCELFLVFLAGWVLLKVPKLDEKTDILLSILLIFLSIMMFILFITMSIINVHKMFRIWQEGRLIRLQKLLEEQEKATETQTNLIRLREDDPLTAALEEQSGIKVDRMFQINPLHKQAKKPGSASAVTTPARASTGMASSPPVSAAAIPSPSGYMSPAEDDYAATTTTEEYDA